MNLKTRIEKAAQQVLESSFVFAAFEPVDHPRPAEDREPADCDHANSEGVADGEAEGEIQGRDGSGGEQRLWRHVASDKVFEQQELAEIQAKNPGWILWCREPYDPLEDPLLCHVPLDQVTDEMEADYLAKMEAMEEREAEEEYLVVLTRLATGCSVKGYDEATIAQAKKKLGMD